MSSRSVFASRDCAPGEVIGALRGEERDRPSLYTIQIAAHRHLELVDESSSTLEFRYLNHSCDPNASVDVRGRILRALGPIAIGEELTIDYLATEWRLSNPFDCHCGSARCRGRIAGFAMCPPTVRAELSGLAAPHLLALARGSAVPPPYGD